MTSTEGGTRNANERKWDGEEGGCLREDDDEKDREDPTAEMVGGQRTYRGKKEERKGGRKILKVGKEKRKFFWTEIGVG